jgi:hypothetical protein
MENGRTSDVGWFPLRGSYEEAVLSWHEQIEMSFRRRTLDARHTLTGQEAPTRRGLESKTTHAVSD